VTNKQVIDKWIKQRGNGEGHNPARSLYFIGPTIYSYSSHFPIARFSADRKSVVVTTRQDSSTTNKHISQVVSKCDLAGIPITRTGTVE
jgi:hypothetical protein